MKDRPHNDPTPAQRRAADAVRDLPRPVADAEFRLRLKERFIEGDFAAVAVPRRGTAARLLRLPGRAPRWAAWMSLAVAAALALMVANNPRPGPELLRVDGEGTITIDGETVTSDRPETIGGRLRPGARLVLSEDVSLDLRYPGTMAWRLEPGTEVVLPRAPGRWYGRSLEFHLAFGEVALRTGPDFPGLRLAIATGEGRAVVTGTLVSVYRDSAVTCVCVEEGAVVMETGDEILGTVAAGRRAVLFRDGRPPLLDDAIAPPHQQHLQAFDGACANAFAPPE